jgi:hypothetical protein
VKREGTGWTPVPGTDWLVKMTPVLTEQLNLGFDAPREGISSRMIDYYSLAPLKLDPERSGVHVERSQ